MSTMASQITSLVIVCSNVYSGADQRKHQSSASLAFVWGIHRWPVNSPHKGPVPRKLFPFDGVIMCRALYLAALRAASSIVESRCCRALSPVYTACWGPLIHSSLKNNTNRTLTLWPNDSIWRRKSGSALAQVMACCLTAPSHYLNQCWLIISEVQWQSYEGNFTRDALTINH